MKESRSRRQAFDCRRTSASDVTRTNDSRAISTALFGLGLLLPLAAGGNVLFLLEPEDGIRYFILATLGVSWLLATRSRNEGSPPTLAAVFLITLVAWWCGNLALRDFGPHALTDAQGLFCAALLYGVFSWRPPDAEEIRRLIAGLLVGAMITTAYGQYQYWVMYPRVTQILSRIGQEPIVSVNANFYNANCYAPFLAALILLSTGLCGKKTRALFLGFQFVGILALLITLALTGSRSTLGLLFLTALGLGIFTFREVLGRWTAGAWIGVTLTVIAAAIAVATSMNLGELWTVGTLGRLAIWEGAAAMIRDHWLFGVGLGQFADHFPHYRLTSYYTRYPHNLFLEVFAESGVVGVVALVGFCGTSLVVALRSLFSKHRIPRFALQPPLIAAALLLLIHSLFDIDWHAPANPILLFTLFALSQREPDSEAV